MSGEWTPLATDFFAGTRVRMAGRDAALLYLAGLCYAQHHVTDGVVPDVALDLLAASCWVKPKVAEALVREGLWDRLHGGWFIVDWFEWNKTAAQIEALRERERNRKQKWRDTKEARRAEDAVRDASRDVDAASQSRSTPSTDTSCETPTEVQGGFPQADHGVVTRAMAKARGERIDGAKRARARS